MLSVGPAASLPAANGIRGQQVEVLQAVRQAHPVRARLAMCNRGLVRSARAYWGRSLKLGTIGRLVVVSSGVRIEIRIVARLCAYPRVSEIGNGRCGMAVFGRLVSSSDSSNDLRGAVR